MTIEEWAKDFKSYVNELQMPRDDYKSVMSYIDDALLLLKEQEAVEDALALLKKQRWIPVSERLPDVGQSVLVYAVGKIDGFIGEHVTEICKRFVMRFLPSSPGHEVWSSPYQFFHTDYEITHWMPLPEMPKEDNDNG